MYCKCHNIYIYLVLILCFSLSGLAQNPNAPPPLSTLPIPEPSNLGDFVKNKQKAIELGKALFWDMQAGGDGVQACASCHFQAGADVRIKNQLSPHGAPPATDPGASFEVGGPNYTVQRADFPFRELSDPEDRNSTVLFDSDDVFSSQGVFDAMFNDIIPGAAADDMTFVADPVFNVNGINTRRVEPRNTPPVINAVFFVDNFWDGRAKFFFNGVNPFGNLDPNARILEKQPDGSVIPVAILIDRASLASQAVGPPLSDFEMASAGKAFPKIGKKLFSVTPLGLQKVHPNDSVLGYLSLWPNPGISVDYATLIQEAFQNKYWDSDKVFDINRNEIGTGAPSNTNEYNLMEMNFSLFWGLAIQLYEATLVSDQTPYDDFQMGNNNALTAEQKEGLTIFLNQGKCINCHSGAEFAGGTIDQLIDNPVEVNGDLEGIIERMNMAQGQAIYDAGFYNIGVRPTGEDIGRGGTALGEPLSFSRFAKLHGQDAIGIPLNLNPAVDPNERDAVDGAFKTSSLRNIELTGPYFHNGGQATLLEVVQFYTRGGDFHDANIDNLDPDINVIGHIRGKPHRQRALAAFMLALTDERVVYQRAPFDHPQIFLPHGHPGDESSIAGTDPFGNAISDLVEFPAVGAEGASFALKPFLDADQLGPVPPPVVDNVVIAATNSIWLKKGVEVQSGHVGVNNISTTPILDAASGADLSVGVNSFVAQGFGIAANSIVIKSGAQIAGDAYYNSLSNSGTIQGLQFSQLPMPVYPSMPPFETAPAGTNNINVPANTSQILPPGNYKNVIVNDGATLTFTGGEYNINKLTAKTNSQLLFDTFSKIRIADKLKTQTGVTVGPSLNSTEDACGIVFYIAGTNGVNGGVLETPVASQIGTNNTIAANIYAPNGTIWLKSNTNATGAFIGRDVLAGQFTKLNVDSRFEFPVPAFLKLKNGDGTPLASNQVPTTFTLEQNFPNPFNPSTTIRYHLAEASSVTLDVYNMRGQKVRTLVSDFKEAGTYSVIWDAKDNFGSKVASGVYVYQLKAGQSILTKKMVLLK